MLANHSASSQSMEQAPEPPKEILGNTVDEHWRNTCGDELSAPRLHPPELRAGAVPTRSSLTKGGLPFGFIVSPFAAPDDSNRWLRMAA